MAEDKPKASIDQCSNCTYWEPLNARKTHGVCHIITYPAKFRNNLAPIIGPGTSTLFTPIAGFHCTLYKVRK